MKMDATVLKIELDEFIEKIKRTTIKISWIERDITIEEIVEVVNYKTQKI